MSPQELRNRTKRFALDVLRLTRRLPANRTTDVITRQLIRSDTSVGANYRSACRARSRADFIAKMKIVEEEVDESAYWMELLIEDEILPESSIRSLTNEARQILAIVVASIKTSRTRER